MREYKGYFTIIDDRNGEIVGELKDIEINEDSLPEEGIEQLEEFIGLSINQYEEDVWPAI